MPPATRIFSVLKLQCAPAPFQSPIHINDVRVDKRKQKLRAWKVELHEQRETRALNWLRIDGDDDAEKLRHAAHYVACDPQVVAHLNAFRWPHLILPLRLDEQIHLDLSTKESTVCMHIMHGTGESKPVRASLRR